jgi:lipoprotein-anchoring transpeptidase ErfK/SrfK
MYLISLLRRKAFAAALATALVAAGASLPAAAQDASESAPHSAAAVEETPARAGGFDAVSAAEQIQPQAAPVADPCAAFAGSYNSYYLCQDRIKKIERLRGPQKPAAPQAAPASTVPPDPAQQAAEKAAEIERMLKEKEQAEAAKEAEREAKRYKKGLGKSTGSRKDPKK